MAFRTHHHAVWRFKEQGDRRRKEALEYRTSDWLRLTFKCKNWTFDESILITEWLSGAVRGDEGKW